MARILVFGDSITLGAMDPEYGGWVGRLRSFCNQKRSLDFIVYNLGVSGDKTTGLLKRLELETKARMREGEDVIFIFAIGINDSYFIHSKNNFRTLPEKFKENIKKLINLAQKLSSKIIFIGLAPVDETKTTPLPWDTDKSYKNEYIKKYDEIISSICKERNIKFIEVFDRWIKSDYKNLLADGLHPNAKGHQKIFEIVKDFLTKNKII